ncbi:uncharacterized protein HaLaN_04506 [Haematococcus lacustris]|uniref:Uncharacterized protein n=1 Tax=Haematococcus lacustris TaxID=44745 RepID=A0A699Z1X5_HAELA|nr:uncharacterized protein HaLaN_04506 [Haematococcus lacustris]
MTPASMAAAAMTQTEPDFVLRPSKRLQQDAEMERLAREDWSYFRLIVAPAAGPRNFVSMGLDPQLSASWHNPKAHEQLQEGKRRRAWPETWLLGGSMAALRWAALCSGGGATDALQSAFCKMAYKHGDTGETLGAYMQELLGIAAPDPGKVVHHPSMRLALMVSELKPWCAAISKLHLQSLFYMLLVSPAQLHTLYPPAGYQSMGSKTHTSYGSAAQGGMSYWSAPGWLADHGLLLSLSNPHDTTWSCQASLPADLAPTHRRSH